MIGTKPLLIVVNNGLVTIISLLSFSLEFHVSSAVENDQFCYCFRLNSVGRPLYLAHGCIIEKRSSFVRKGRELFHW